ncbi:hypothetical protein BLNAU_4553 [Blattamonas nauphoetae]|uniref:Uncharacterized protein n=1 Tax=Blattamonas nauphoetae TaxID=2049346 RepID=A0ABQ9Y9G0_9EUKA|nr:hypothetical protein BLNAU_4553 [Blattamonas nauphoetae]
MANRNVPKSKVKRTSMSLEQETRMMEDKLLALRLQMEEERKKRAARKQEGGFFWAAGQKGSLKSVPKSRPQQARNLSSAEANFLTARSSSAGADDGPRRAVEGPTISPPTVVTSSCGPDEGDIRDESSYPALPQWEPGDKVMYVGGKKPQETAEEPAGNGEDDWVNPFDAQPKAVTKAAGVETSTEPDNTVILRPRATSAPQKQPKKFSAPSASRQAGAEAATITKNDQPPKRTLRQQMMGKKVLKEMEGDLDMKIKTNTISTQQ